MQHNYFVSSNFCKELDLARFHQRVFFVLFFCRDDHMPRLEAGCDWRKQQGIAPCARSEKRSETDLQAGLQAGLQPFRKILAV